MPEKPAIVRCTCSHAKTRHRQQYGEPHTGACRDCGCQKLELETVKPARCEALRVDDDGRTFECEFRADYWVGPHASCADCIATLLSDEGPTVVVPITDEPVLEISL